MNVYAGIGSRRTPDDILISIRQIAYMLALEKWTLRSGAAPGADSAFEYGCDLANGPKEIYLPWKKFQGSNSQLFKITDEAMKIASKHHNNWSKLAYSVKNLMGRNVYQILGENLNTPVDFVICWTSDGCISKRTRSRSTGGTGLAIELAESYNIPVFNLGGI